MLETFVVAALGTPVPPPPPPRDRAALVAVHPGDPRDELLALRDRADRKAEVAGRVLRDLEKIRRRKAWHGRA